jgi:hypothetical protein
MNFHLFIGELNYFPGGLEQLRKFQSIFEINRSSYTRYLGHCHSVYSEGSPAGASSSIADWAHLLINIWTGTSMGKKFRLDFLAMVDVVQGGLITYTVAQIPEVSAAVERFSANVTDPKAGLISAYNFLAGQVVLHLILNLICSDHISAWNFTYHVL